MQIELAPAYILHRYPFKDYDWMLKLWLKDHGLKTAVMRGARRPKSKYRAVSQPFMPLQISLKGRGDVLSVTACEADGVTPMLFDNAQAIAFYLNELLLTFLPKGDALPDFFGQYQALLQLLDGEKEEDKVINQFVSQGSSYRGLTTVSREGASGAGSRDQVTGRREGKQAVAGTIEIKLREFEMALFHTMGIGMHFAVDINGDVIVENTAYLIQPGMLPRIVQSNTAIPTNGVVVMGEILIAIEQCNWHAGSLKWGKKICRLWISHYSHGKKFKSRELFKKS